MGALQITILLAVLVLSGVHFFRQTRQKKVEFAIEMFAEFFVQIVLPVLIFLILFWLWDKDYLRR